MEKTIKEISFDEIKYYWRNFLWSKFNESNSTDLETHKTDLTTQKNYSYILFDHLNREFIERIQKPIYIACFINNKIVGVESGYQTNTDYYRLRGLWVDDKYRRQGIATMLVRYLEERTNKTYIWTIPRESALNFYLNYGFKVVNEYKESIYGKTFFVIKKNNFDKKI